MFAEASSPEPHKGIRKLICLRAVPPAQAGVETVKNRRFWTGTRSMFAERRLSVESVRPGPPARTRGGEGTEPGDAAPGPRAGQGSSLR